MKFTLSVTLSALALASQTFAADLEDRSYPYYAQQQHAQEEGAHNGMMTTTVHDVMVSTTTATKFVTVTMGAQEQAVCTSSTQSVEATGITTSETAVYQTPVFVSASVEAPAPQETTSTDSVEAQSTQQYQYGNYATTTLAAANAYETSSMYQQYHYGSGDAVTTTYEATNAYETTTLAAQEQEQPATSMETVTSTRTYATTVVWATPTVVTQMEHDTTVVHTVDVTRTSTRLVTETQLVTRTKTKFVHETETRTEQAQHTGGSQNHHNNGNGHGNHDTSAGTTTTTSSAAADTTNSAATVADVNTSDANTGVVTVTDFETSTFLVTTTIDGAVSTETGTTTIDVGTTTTSGASDTTTSDAAAATIADASTSSTDTTTDAASTTSDVSSSTAATTSTSADAANNTGDPQTSLTLDPRVIEDGFTQDGQNPPVAGQVPSLTSKNNFINFCLTQSDVPLTDGKQIRTGSCNPVPQGSIIAKDKIPSAKFVFPLNFGKIPANQAFTAKLKIKNLQAGAFTNAQLNYYAAPAQVNDSGVLIGHSHLVIEQLTSIDDTEPLDPTKFAFFKGLNSPLDGDSTLSATLDKGLPAGVYRMFSINTAANHQPALASIAQHGSMDDGVYFTAQ